MLEIRPLEDQAALKKLLAGQPLQPFLQSWAWGDFQLAVGRRIWRLGAWQGSELVGAALVVEHQLVLGKNYLYCPRGPLATSAEVLQQLLEALPSCCLIWLVFWCQSASSCFFLASCSASSCLSVSVRKSS